VRGLDNYLQNEFPASPGVIMQAELDCLGQRGCKGNGAFAMEDWVLRALQRWPNVPHLYGWLKLDRRGRWLIKGETISRPQIIDTINRNYAADDQGRWYFQNGPQRGYVQLEYAPLVLRMSAGDVLTLHTDERVEQVSEVFMDESGALLFHTEHGAAALIDDELEWALQRMYIDDELITDDQLAAALALTTGSMTPITLRLGQQAIAIQRLDSALAPAQLHFVRDPQP
jgi:hypothetical protein